MSAETVQRCLDDIGALPRLAHEDELRLVAQAHRGDEDARNQVVCANLRLVVTIAGEFFGRGLPFLDLVSEGNLGLIKAIERFDPLRRCKLSMYAAWWIKEFINRAIYKQTGVISVPPRAARKAAKLYKAAEHLAQSMGRDPDDEELVAELGNDLGYTRERIRQIETKALAKMRARLRVSPALGAASRKART